MTSQPASDIRPCKSRTIRYTRERLYNIRRTRPCTPEPTQLHSLKQLGLLKYRGTRAGKSKFKPRPIQVITTRNQNINNQMIPNNNRLRSQRTPVLVEINPTRFMFPTLINTNLRGALVGKVDELSTVLLQNNITVACFTESWLTKEIPTQVINIDGFTCHRKDRSDGRRGGGVVIFLRDDLASTRLGSLEDDKFEVMW